MTAQERIHHWLNSMEGVPDKLPVWYRFTKREPTVTKSEAELIRAMRDSGSSLMQIANEFYLSTYVVARVLKEKSTHGTRDTASGA